MDSFAQDGISPTDDAVPEEDRAPTTLTDEDDSKEQEDSKELEDSNQPEGSEKQEASSKQESSPEFFWFSEDLATISDKMKELSRDEGIVRYCHDALVEIQKFGVDVSAALHPLQEQADRIGNQKLSFSDRLHTIYSDLHSLMQDICDEASQVESRSELPMPPPLPRP